MSNPALQLAAAIVSMPLRNGDPAERLASALLEANRDCLAANERCQQLHRQLNAKVHECETLREALGRAVQGERQTRAAMVIYCQPGCHAVLELNGPPPDSEVDTWVRLAGWGVGANGERLCKGCRR